VSTWLGLDGGWRDQADAEHAVLHLLGELGADPAGAVACTHLVGAGTARAHVAATVELPGAIGPGLPAVPDGTAVAVRRQGRTEEHVEDGAGPPELLAAAREVIGLHRSRIGGRAFSYAGQSAVSAAMSAAEITSRTEIAAVVDLAGRVLPEHEVVKTFGFARPAFSGGQLVLMVGPYADGQHVPFELEHPTQCCAFH